MERKVGGGVYRALCSNANCPLPGPTICLRAWPLRVLPPRLTGNLIRRIDTESYYRRGPMVSITTDASPYGIGAVLEIDSVIVSWFRRVYLPQPIPISVNASER